MENFQILNNNKMEHTLSEKEYGVYTDVFNSLGKTFTITNSFEDNSVLYKKRVRNNDWKKRLNSHFKNLNNLNKK